MLSCTSFFDRKIVQNNLGELFVSWIRFIFVGVVFMHDQSLPPPPPLEILRRKRNSNISRTEIAKNLKPKYVRILGIVLHLEDITNIFRQDIFGIPNNFGKTACIPFQLDSLFGIGVRLVVICTYLGFTSAWRHFCCNRKIID